MKSKLFFLSLLFFACSQETVAPTSSQLVQQELQRVIDDQKIAVVYILTAEQTPPGQIFVDRSGYSFSNGFVNVPGFSRQYNLAYLTSYVVVETDVIFSGRTVRQKVLFLSF